MNDQDATEQLASRLHFSVIFSI